MGHAWPGSRLWTQTRESGKLPSSSPVVIVSPFLPPGWHRSPRYTAHTTSQPPGASEPAQMAGTVESSVLLRSIARRAVMCAAASGMPYPARGALAAGAQKGSEARACVTAARRCSQRRKGARVLAHAGPALRHAARQAGAQPAPDDAAGGGSRTTAG